METITRHLRIEGRVQGVCYRASMADAARRLGVAGWVRNRADGSVEALVQGAPEAVQALVDWAHRGPERAQVDAVRATAVADAPRHDGFEQRATA